VCEADDARVCIIHNIRRRRRRLSSRAISLHHDKPIVDSTHLALGETFAGFWGESVADTFFVRMKT